MNRYNYRSFEILTSIDELILYSSGDNNVSMSAVALGLSALLGKKKKHCCVLNR